MSFRRTDSRDRERKRSRSRSRDRRGPDERNPPRYDSREDRGDRRPAGNSSDRYGASRSDDRYGGGRQENRSGSSYGSGGDGNRGGYGRGGDFGGGRGHYGPPSFGGGRGGGGYQGGRGDGRGKDVLLVINRIQKALGRGGKRSMGEVDAVQSLLRNDPNSNDAACLRIINSVMDENIREQRIEVSASESGTKYYLQPLENWRIAHQVGVMLDNSTHIIRANAFRVNARALPRSIFHYHVSIFRYDRTKTMIGIDLAKEKDVTLNIGLIKSIIQSSAEWLQDSQGRKIGLAYDGRSSMYSTVLLPVVTSTQTSGGTVFESDVVFPVDSTNNYFVAISLAENGEIEIPRSNDDWRDRKDQAALQCLDSALVCFAKWQQAERDAEWIIAGNKVFRTNGTSYDFGAAYVGRLGYYFSLKACMSGLVLMTDVSVSCFMKGGKFVDLMATIGGFKSLDDMCQSIDFDRQGFPRAILDRVESVLKGYKIRLLHLGHRKTFKSFGPAAKHRDSAFTLEDGSSMTVEQYFEEKANSNEVYRKVLPRGKLKYPQLPTLNVGSRKKPILIPVEVAEIIPGQSKTQGLPAEIANNIIKHAAMVPGDRFRHIDTQSKKNGPLFELHNDENSVAFGFGEINETLMKVQGFILPPPKLQYKNRVIEPELKGSWNLAGGVQFAFPPPADESGSTKIKFGVIVVFRDRRPSGQERLVDDFIDKMETESKLVNIPLSLCFRPEYVPDIPEHLSACLLNMKNQGARIVMVLLNIDAYAIVKYASDAICMPTQCIKWANLVRPPKGYFTSLLVKMNYKMGGVNHTLASRLPSNAMQLDESSFQFPPKSLSWLFDDPCMVMGVDVSHPEKGDTKSRSIAAVVGSMDGMLGQYCAHISVCDKEPVSDLERAFSKLIQTFCARNEGKVPRRIIIYRDGVADNQFDQVIEKELTALKSAFHLSGYDDGYVKIAIVVCQKRHRTRFVYEQGGKGVVNGEPEYLNPCVGLCVDARSNSNAYPDDPNAPGSIAAPNMNEFYLNSHAAILGTSKPCKYTLIYDEIGLELIEVELLTFWTTHLYCRCTKAVSYATPAYYAHVASRRGKHLLSAGASADRLVDVTEAWLNLDTPSMYFA